MYKTTKMLSSMMFILTVIGYTSICAEQEEYVVRKVNWGMTPEQVRESETWEFLQDTEKGGQRLISYKGTLLNYTCSLQYTFESQKLIHVVYGFLTDSLSETNEAFNLFKSLLTEKYGETKKLPLVWQIAIAQSIQEGTITKYLRWITKDNKTSIVLFDIPGGLSVTYSDKQHEDIRINNAGKQTKVENPF